MKLGKKAQYAMLFVLYLSRSGLSNIATVSANLKLSPAFLEQIARSLRIAGIIKVKRGPGGGCEVVGNPTVGEVLKAVGVGPLLTPTETTWYAHGGSESRALGLIVGNMSLALSTALKVPVSEGNVNLVREEVAQLDTADVTRPC